MTNEKESSHEIQQPVYNSEFDSTRKGVPIAMHCNLRSLDVAPVVLGFTYEAHSALVYHNFNTTIGQYAAVDDLANFLSKECFFDNR